MSKKYEFTKEDVWNQVIENNVNSWDRNKHNPVIKEIEAYLKDPKAYKDNEDKYRDNVEDLKRYYKAAYAQLREKAREQKRARLCEFLDNDYLADWLLKNGLYLDRKKRILVRPAMIISLVTAYLEQIIPTMEEEFGIENIKLIPHSRYSAYVSSTNSAKLDLTDVKLRSKYVTKENENEN